MRRVFTIILVLAFVVSGMLVSCSKDETEAVIDDTEVAPDNNEEEKPEQEPEPDPEADPEDENSDEEEPEQEEPDEEEPEPDPDPEPEPDPEEPEQDPSEMDGPSITWASNPNFDTVTLSDKMDVSIIVDAPAGIDQFYVTIDCSSTIVSLALSTMFGIEAGKQYDIITDDDLISLLVHYNVPCGWELKYATHVDFELSDLMEYIYGYYDALSMVEKLLVTGDVYIDVEVVDIVERSATARATFAFP